MKYRITTTLLLLFTFCFVNAQEEKENPFSVKWDKGLKIESADKQFKIKFGGRLMIDHAFFSQDTDLDAVFGELETKNGTEIRRARVYASGAIYHNVVYKLQVDFAGRKVTLKDAYIGLKDIPVIGNVLVGHIKEPFRLETITSSKYSTFMERSFLNDFSQERNNGILFFNSFLDKKITLQAGYFRNSDVTANSISSNNGYAITARLTGLPIHNTEKKQLLHLGIGFSNRKLDTEIYRIASRPEAHLSSVKYISTGIITDVNTVNLLNLESAFIAGPFSFQAEYLTATVATKAVISDYKFAAYYGQMSYFLTGENKKYKNWLASFGRVSPKHNFGSDKGSGAWEIALRYSNSNLNSKDIFGGEQSDITLGLNWYLNPSTRILFNHVWANVKDTGKATVFQARFQIDF